MGIHEGIVVFNYRLSRELGDGGFGVVYLAEHTELPRRAAVKILHPEYARRNQVVDRFFREARAVCEIGHPAIVDVTNFGRLETGEPFYMMEFVDGQSISEVTKESGPMTFEQVSQVFALVADALEAAHAKGIVHRDLKPDNIMLVKRGGRIADAKLLDFGIAKLLSEQDPIKSHTGMAMGTPAYMAPEQARDAKNVDGRADVYGFGATIFAALAGRPPFEASNTTDLLIAVATQEAPRLSSVRGGIPPALDQAIAMCLAKGADQRPPTIRDAWMMILRGLGYQPPAFGRQRLGSQHGLPTMVPVGQFGQMPPTVRAHESGQLPAVAAADSGQLPAVGARESGQLPTVAAADSGQLAAHQSGSIPVAVGVEQSGGIPVAVAADQSGGFQQAAGPHGTVPLGASSDMISAADVAKAQALGRAQPNTTLGGAGGEVQPAPAAAPPRKRRGMLAGILTVGVAGATVAGLMMMKGGDRKDGKRTDESGGPVADPGGPASDPGGPTEPPPVIADAAVAVATPTIDAAPATPDVDCSYRGFKIAIRSAKSDPNVAADALARLETCHGLGMAVGKDYRQLKKDLTRAIVPPCDAASFDAVLAIEDVAERKAAGAAALKRLDGCKAAGKIGRRDHKKLAKKLAATQKDAAAATTTGSGPSDRLKRFCRASRWSTVASAAAPSYAAIRQAETELNKCRRLVSSRRYRDGKAALEHKRKRRQTCDWGILPKMVRATGFGSSAISSMRSRVQGCRAYLTSAQYSSLNAELDRKARPRTDCSASYFKSALASSSTNTARAAISRAHTCRREGQLSGSSASQLIKGLENRIKQLQTPTLDCSDASFRRVYLSSSVSKSTVRAALRRLKQCRSKLGTTTYQQYHAALTAKLLE